ncbi:CHAT domain-containing protein [Haloplanus halobius]|uniref:CHAT domain-containing protein n=1 Tax=Haloplanus halobius TaxID=2934938 RepID=UPI00200D2C9C|nr:CHAT domain-containing protein [Haloplanus sp. XH21]
MSRSGQARGGRADTTDEPLEVSFSSLDDESGLVVTDLIERDQFRLYTDTPVSPSPADPSAHRFPVDAAVTIGAAEIELPTVVSVCVRDDAGEMLAETEHFAYEEFPAGTYSLELCGPIKIYLRVDAPVTVASDVNRTRIEFDDHRQVHVGARSHHEGPAATITTTDDPTDVMAAVSEFSSALKTTSPERSYPTLRGHPPLVELGDAVDVPDALSSPETGVRLELPPDYESIYVAAPLAYYVAADVVPGGAPRLVTDDGFEHDLDTVRGFETEVERVLKQTFFLDCVTRTEGYYNVDLHERAAVETDLDLDFEWLYEQSLSTQLEEYLSVPFGAVEDELPEWRLTSHVAPTPENVELLPFVTNDLAVVRTPQDQPEPSSAVQTTAANEFFRDEAFTRSAAADEASRSYVQPETTDSLEQSWVGEGAPIGASKATTAAFYNRLDRTPTDGDIGITVVCNDPRMADERDVVDAVYGSREELPFDVQVHHDLTQRELRRVLSAEADLLHYIGHIDAEGFECADGKLDATTLTDAGADAFLLNACQSYEQGSALIEAGAIAGIVTLSDVINSGAVRIGRMLARLLNRGFTIGSALEVARDDSVIGDQYTVIGDSSLSLARTDGGPPNVCVVNRTADGYELGWKPYPATGIGMGSLVMPWINDEDQYYLWSGDSRSFDMTADELQQFLSLETVPVKIDGSLVWSDELDFSTL